MASQTLGVGIDTIRGRLDELQDFRLRCPLDGPEQAEWDALIQAEASWLSQSWDIVFVGRDRVADVVVTVRGEMTATATTACLCELVGDERWRPGMKVLLDYTGARPGNFSGDDVGRVAGGPFFDERWGPGRFAVVTENLAIYGITRMWQAATRTMALQTEVFHSREDALAWLDSPR